MQKERNIREYSLGSGVGGNSRHTNSQKTLFQDQINSVLFSIRCRVAP